MAISVVQCNTVYDSSGNNAVTGSFSADPNPGSVLVAVVDIAVDLPSVNAAEWTQIRRAAGDGGMLVAYRLTRDGDTATNLPPICHGLGSGGDWNATLLELAGVDLDAPVDASAIGSVNIPSGAHSVSTGTLTTTHDGALVLTSMQIDMTGSFGLVPTYSTSPASASATLRANDSIHSGSGSNQQVGTSVQGSAGDIVGTFTYGGAGVSQIQSNSPWIMVAFTAAAVTTAWPDRLIDADGSDFRLRDDADGDLLLGSLPDPTPCTLTFADTFGDPLPPLLRVDIGPPLGQGHVSPLSVYVGAGSSAVVPLYVGFNYTAQFFGHLAPPVPVNFVAASAVTLVPDRYVSPWQTREGYAGTDVGLGFFFPLGRAAAAELAPGGSLRPLFDPIAAVFAKLDAFHRSVVAGQRLDTSIDAQIDSWVLDFLGPDFKRVADETNAAYIARVKAWIQTPFGTLPAVAAAVASYFADFPDGSTGVRVFNRRTDPDAAAFYGLQPGQLAVLMRYLRASAPPAFYIGQAHLGQTTFLTRGEQFSSSFAAPYAELGRRVDAVKSGVSTPVYITSHS